MRKIFPLRFLEKKWQKYVKIKDGKGKKKYLNAKSLSWKLSTGWNPIKQREKIECRLGERKMKHNGCRETLKDEEGGRALRGAQTKVGFQKAGRSGARLSFA